MCLKIVYNSELLSYKFWGWKNKKGATISERIISSVIRQKSESQNRCLKKTKHVKFYEKTNISNPLICTRTCTYQGVRNVRFFRKFDVPCFLETPVLRFALLPYYRRCMPSHQQKFTGFYKGYRNSTYYLFDSISIGFLRK